jgi:hypothetical protein
VHSVSPSLPLCLKKSTKSSSHFDVLSDQVFSVKGNIAHRFSRARARDETRRDETSRDETSNRRTLARSSPSPPPRARPRTHVVGVSEDVTKKAIGVSRHLRRRASAVSPSGHRKRIFAHLRVRVAFVRAFALASHRRRERHVVRRSFAVRSLVRSLVRAFAFAFASSSSVVVCRDRAARGAETRSRRDYFLLFKHMAPRRAQYVNASRTFVPSFVGRANGKIYISPLQRARTTHRMSEHTVYADVSVARECASRCPSDREFQTTRGLFARASPNVVRFTLYT